MTTARSSKPTVQVRGVVENDPKRLIHAGTLGDHPDEYFALCGAGRIIAMPGPFDPADPKACPECRRIVTGR
jgi:hypothetical protein